MPPSLLSRFSSLFSLALVLMVAAATGFYFYGHTFRGLTPGALDCAQLARNIFRGAGFSSDILPAGALAAANPRAFNPEMGQGPLFPLLLGALFSIAGERDGVVAGFSLALFVASAALLFWLARRLTQSTAIATLSALTFALSLPVLGLGILGQPQSLSGFLLLLTLLALTPKALAAETRFEDAERRSIALHDYINPGAGADAPGTDATGTATDGADAAASPREAGQPNYFVAGLCAAACYLSDPLALLFLVPLIAGWGRGLGGWKRRSVASFALGFGILALPWWIRNARLVGNPLFSLRWLAPEAATGVRGLLGNLGRNAPTLLLGAASLPSLILTPFIVVSPWMRPLSVALSRARSATLTALGWTIVIGGALGHRDLILLLPLAPLLALLGIATFRQITGDALSYRLKNGAELGMGTRFWLGFLALCGLRGMRAEILARHAYRTPIEAPSGDAAPDSAISTRRRRHLSRGWAALLFLMACPLLALPMQPVREGAREILSPLGRAVPSDRVITTDAPQALAWYGDRRVTPLPADIKAWLAAPQSRNGAIYLSGSSGLSTVLPAQWREVAQRGVAIPGYRLVPQGRQAGASNLFYIRQPSSEEARTALRAQPKNGAVYLALGQACLQSGDFARALSAFQSASRLLPRSGEAFYGAGLAYGGLKNASAAQAQFKRALAIEPRSVAALLELARFEQTKPDKRAAIALYERILADVPNQPLALNNLAQLYADQGTQLFRALELARRAAAQNPRNGSVLDTLGGVCARLGYRAEAVAYFRRAAQMSPQNPRIAARLKQAQAKLKTPPSR